LARFHGQLNLLVDLIQIFYITWGKRQDDFDIKLERLYKEHKQLEEKYSLIQNKLNLVLQDLEERKTEQNKYCQNSDYIKEEISVLSKKLEVKRLTKESEESRPIPQDIVNIKRLVEEIKTLVIS